MRRSELATAVGSVRDALTSSEMQERIWETIRSPEKTRTNPALVAAISAYAISASQFDQIAARAAQLMGLSPLTDPAFWAELLAGPSNRPTAAREVLNSINSATKTIPALLALLNDSDLGHLRENLARNKAPTQEILTVILFEDSEQFSRPARVAELFYGVQALYDSCAMLLDESPDNLSLVGCDAGSDKAFDFLGVAKVVQQVKEVVISLWDRVVFYRFQQAEQKMRLILESLPILTQIREKEQSGHLSPEMAAILRNKVMEGATLFVNAGAIIPEAQAKTNATEPRKLLAPEQKLLANPMVGNVSTPREERHDAIHHGDSETTTYEDAEPSIAAETAGGLTAHESELLELLKKKQANAKRRKRKT